MSAFDSFLWIFQKKIRFAVAEAYLLQSWVQAQRYRRHQRQQWVGEEKVTTTTTTKRYYLSEDVILPLCSCWVCSTVWCIRNVCFIINSLPFAIVNMRNVKQGKRTNFFSYFFFSLFPNTCCCCFLSFFICSCYLSLLFSFVVRLSSKCVLFKFVLYE